MTVLICMCVCVCAGYMSVWSVHIRLFMVYAYICRPVYDCVHVSICVRVSYVHACAYIFMSTCDICACLCVVYFRCICIWRP